MKAAVLHAAGAAPLFEEFDDPVAGEGEELVEVSAASLKRAAACSGKAILEAVPQILQHSAQGRLKIEMKRVPLSEVASAWNETTSDGRVVFVT